MQWNFGGEQQRVHFQSLSLQQQQQQQQQGERGKEQQQSHHVSNYIFNRKHASQSYVTNELETYKGGVNSYLESHSHQKVPTVINRSVGTLNPSLSGGAHLPSQQQQQLSEIQKNIFRKIYKESKGGLGGSKMLEERRLYENQRVSQTQNLEKLQQRLNQIVNVYVCKRYCFCQMDWKKSPEDTLVASGARVLFAKSLSRNAPKSQTFKKSADYSVRNYMNYDKNWRSITPEAMESQDRRAVQEKVVTEPNDQKKIAKSLSQESSLLKQQGSKFQDKSAANLRHQFLIQEEDEFDTSNKKRGGAGDSLSQELRAGAPDSVQKFSKPLSETAKQKSSITKLNELSHQINNIIIQCKQSNVKYKKDQIHRPQSELISMYDIGKSSLLRIRQQGSTQLSSVNSTNLHLRRNQDEFDQFNDQIRGGTETERSYLNQKYPREGLFENDKKMTQMLLLRHSPNGHSYQRKNGSLKKVSGIFNNEKSGQFYRSMNDDFVSRDDDVHNDEADRSVKKPLLDKKLAFSSESQKSGNKKSSDQNQLYLEYMRLIQRKPLVYKERSPQDQQVLYLNKQCSSGGQVSSQRNASGVELPQWSGEKSDQGRNKLSFRVSSYYTQNQQSQSQSSFRQREEDREKENSKSENATSRNTNLGGRLVVASQVSEATPTKAMQAFRDSMRQFHSPKVLPHQLPSCQVSNSKINSLLSSMNKFQQIISSEKEAAAAVAAGSSSAVLNSRSQRIQFDEFNLQMFKLGSRSLMMSADPNQTHILVACQDFTVRMLNLYSGRVNVLGKHKRPLSALSNVAIVRQAKAFYSGSRDGVVRQWVSDSMHGNYKLAHQMRLKEAPLQILVSGGSVFILTANAIYCGEQVTLNGSVSCMLQTPANELLVAIGDTIYRVANNQVVEPQIQLMGHIIQMVQDDQQIFVLTRRSFLCVLEDKQKLSFLHEINLDCDVKAIQVHSRRQILALTEENRLLLVSCDAPFEVREQFGFDCEVTSFLTQNSIILVAKKNKQIETLKCA